MSELAADQLRMFVTRLENIDDERKALSDDRKEVVAEAKAHGFDPKHLAELIRRRKMDPQLREEVDQLIPLWDEIVGPERGIVMGGDMERVGRVSSLPPPHPHIGKKDAALAAYLDPESEA